MSNSAHNDRRAWVRLASKLDGNCGRISDGTDPRLPARVKDISSGGLALVLGRPFQPGTVLVVKLRSTESEGPGVLFARVVHVRAQSANQWLTGCAFASPLDEEELRALTT